ncbi:MAG: hypothetical protein HSCHL_0835 [Hydrogenibacillus schlegelii]|uniref:Putative peptidoglycan binding domain-containing protein n=1 Tax=Hydrogenibacillus schlegelii TaxID=1484 RepID=A0A2T5G3H4_HYDSH|nr:DUF1028 domain-containing protein [Hydrogenibacillus schlegelii]PTQ50721.1 MAG: hypothetical protein HSCHL_0835 [Hydrogenibacillus schlegelii]
MSQRANRIAPAPVATFSIVAYDPATGDVGVAVASKFLAVGSVVPWVKAGVGAVATQAWANPQYGPEGLRLIAEGKSAEEALAALVAGDERRAVRQVGLVDIRGGAATYTGEACTPWAGGRTGRHYAVQGNILTGPEVIERMAAAFERTDGELAERLLRALWAGEAAGGDARGKQSAALVVERPGGGYDGLSDRYLDLRVDDHPEPVRELERLLRLHRLVFQRPGAEDFVTIDAALRTELVRALARLGYLPSREDSGTARPGGAGGEGGAEEAVGAGRRLGAGVPSPGDALEAPVDPAAVTEAAFRAALQAFHLRENFEMRLPPEGKIDRAVLAYLRERAAR